MFIGSWHEVLLKFLLAAYINYPIWPVRLKTFVIGQVKSDSLDLKQPIKAYVRAANKPIIFEHFAIDTIILIIIIIFACVR